MDLNARLHVNCGRKDGPISHLAKAGTTAKAGATKTTLFAQTCLSQYFEYSPYYFGYKTVFQNILKNLDLSYKTDLDLWNCLGRVNLYHRKISWD